MTRSEHHADSPQPKVSDAKHQIAQILEHRTTKQEAISSKGLADATGLKPTTVRDTIPEIRREHGLPIVSTSRGYFCAGSWEDVETVLERMAERRATIELRRRELARAWNEQRGVIRS